MIAGKRTIPTTTAASFAECRLSAAAGNRINAQVSVARFGAILTLNMTR